MIEIGSPSMSFDPCGESCDPKEGWGSIGLPGALEEPEWDNPNSLIFIRGLDSSYTSGGDRSVATYGVYGRAGGINHLHVRGDPGASGGSRMTSVSIENPDAIVNIKVR